MAGAFWGIRPPGQEPAEHVLQPVRPEARERLQRAVEEKLAEGFQLESQDDREVVLVRMPRRYLGVTMPGSETRAVVSLDERGYPTVRLQSVTP